ncbi:MAG: magnesium chelatase subunit H [Alphaproteobacteria bacterium]|nr:magnesium chelatase subunit H [Alphaproteobacteria bacterium]
MQKHTSANNAAPVRVVIVTMDSHLASAAERARTSLVKEIPGLQLTLHAASEWGDDAFALERCNADIAAGHIIITTMMFMEEHIRGVLPALQARRETCDAMVCCMSAGKITRQTRLGGFTMDGSEKGLLALLKRLKPKTGAGAKKPPGGAEQMAMLRRVPKILKFIPGTAQDVRAYFLTLQYWLAGSEENIANMVRALVDRYAQGPRAKVSGRLAVKPPTEYPEVGLYHPRMRGRIAERLDDLPSAPATADRQTVGTVGLLVLRSYVLAGNTGHYDGMIAALEARGLRVIPAFASGLDARPAIERYFVQDGCPVVGSVLSLTGFSLVGGPAYNDSKAASEILTRLDVPYLSAHPLEFQTLQQWGASERGLLPVENTIMVAIPELDGATGPTVFGGRTDGSGEACTGCGRGCTFSESKARDMQVCSERADMLAARIDKLIALRRTPVQDRKIAIVLFNFPPNAGNTGTAAYLSVFESLHNTLKAMRKAGYSVEAPATVDDLRDSIIVGNAARYGAMANVAARISASDHVRQETYLGEIEAQWGPAPGRQQSDGSSIFVLGAKFGNVFVGVQPAFGYEGDPMRLLFAKGFAPTHAFSAFCRWLRKDFAANAVLHFGTHGALEFMPGKQAGPSGACWPDRLIGDLPNFYLYASNNPSEGMIAKRRAAATLISYLTPPVAQAGLYRGLVDLKASIERWRGLGPDEEAQRLQVAELVQAQAAALDFVASEPAWGETDIAKEIAALSEEILSLEYALIPHGLHVVGQPPTHEERVDMLLSVADSTHQVTFERAVIEALVEGADPDSAVLCGGGRADPKALGILESLAATDALLAKDHELSGILHALQGRYVSPAPGGDLLRSPDILPTGRNLHGFDPFRIPSAYAMKDGAQQAQRLLERHMADGNALPESIAIVLWGTDNLKNEGAPIAQTLALLGARPCFDTYGRLYGSELIPLEELGRPRVDVVVTMSGIFRDLLPLQIKLIAEACLMAASADEPLDMNFVRKHALEYQAIHGCDLETASLRVFGNADGAYGANVNNLVENGRWNDGDELAETYTNRKGFAYGIKGKPVQHTLLLDSVLKDVDLAYQNLDSVELGVTTVDNYFDTLGGISKAVQRARGGKAAPVYIGDQTTGKGAVRTLSEQVALETRTRALNPKWYEGMLKHGYEGVRQIEVHVTNTMGWSATTGQVSPWVYKQLTETFLLDPEMRARLAALNPTASAKVASRLIEAHERNYWKPDDDMLNALREAGEELEDRLEGIGVEVAA